MAEEPQKTPLYDIHVSAGARMIEFGGWLMPVQYSSILEEHHSVRRAAGLFDLCHMGEIMINGPAALDFVQLIATNDASKLDMGQAQYTLLCDESGGVIDDTLLYRLPDGYLFVINAANTRKDFEWMFRHQIADCDIRDASHKMGMLGLQGPLAEAMLQPLTDVDLASIAYYRSIPGHVSGIEALISRSGYTGEDGFELFCKWDEVEALWRTLSSIKDGPRLCGLGARDTLRLEAAMPLYGHELGEDTNPFEARLGWAVKLEKPRLIGREALSAVKASRPRRLLIGLEMVDQGIARAGFPIKKDGKDVGRVTSGTFAPTLQKSIALAFVPTAMVEIGGEFHVEVRGRPLRARVVPIPFYKRTKQSSK